MSIELTVPYTISAPAGVDGFGEIAVLNDPTGGGTPANFVGYLEDLSFGREVRESAENISEGHGGIHGSFYHGRMPFTMEIKLAIATTFALSNARADKLSAALDAMAADGTIVWTESGRVPTQVKFRQQQSPRGPDKEGKVLFSGVSATPLILAASETTPTYPPTTFLVGGKHATFPIITFTTGTTGNIVLSRTAPSPTETLTMAIGGTSGLAASTFTTVDFAARTVFQGSTDKSGAVQWPSSVWWAFAPGVTNGLAFTGGSGITIKYRAAWLP